MRALPIKSFQKCKGYGKFNNLITTMSYLKQLQQLTCHKYFFKRLFINFTQSENNLVMFAVAPIYIYYIKLTHRIVHIKFTNRPTGLQTHT